MKSNPSAHVQFGKAAALIVALVGSAYVMSTALDSSYGCALGWILLPLFGWFRRCRPCARRQIESVLVHME